MGELLENVARGTQNVFLIEIRNKVGKWKRKKIRDK